MERGLTNPRVLAYHSDMKTILRRFLLIALVFATVSAQAEMRKWTRASDGKAIEAEFVEKVDNKSIKIKMANGREFTIPLASLSPADNEFVKELEAKMATPTDKPAAPVKVPEGEVTVTLSGVHMSCSDCVEAIHAVKEHDKIAVDPAVEIEANKSEGTVVVKAPNGKAAQTALRAMFSSGFYGKSDNDAIKMPELREDDFTTNTMVVRDPNLRCRGSLRAFTNAIESVDGVDEVDAKEGSTRVSVKGENFKTYDVMKALRDIGMGGTFQ